MDSDRRNIKKEGGKEEVSQEFNIGFQVIPAEIQVLIASFLSKKDLAAFKATATQQRDVVDHEILENSLHQLLIKLPYDDLIAFIKSTFEQLNRTEPNTTVLDKFLDLSNLAILFNRLEPADLLGFLQFFHEKHQPTFDDIIKNFFTSHADSLLEFLTKLDRNQADQFNQMYPNLFEEQVKNLSENQQPATLAQKIIFILTASHVDRIRLDLPKVYKEYRGEGPIPPEKLSLAASLSAQAIVALGFNNSQAHDIVGINNSEEPTVEAVNNSETNNIDRYVIFEHLLHQMEQHVHTFTNLKGLDASKLRISGKNLSHSDFSDVNFSGSSFYLVNLSRSTFFRANLAGVLFSKCKLHHANFQFANLENACFIDIDLSTINFSNANLNGTQFIAAENFKTPNILSAVLFDIYDQIATHQNREQITLAIAKQIKNYVVDLANSNPGLASDLLETARGHGIFLSPSSPDVFVDPSTAQSMSFSQKSSLFQKKSDPQKILASAMVMTAVDLKNTPPVIGKR